MEVEEERCSINVSLPHFYVARKGRSVNAGVPRLCGKNTHGEKEAAGLGHQQGSPCRIFPFGEQCLGLD